MRKLADISSFMAVQNRANRAMSVFNTNIEDIKTAVEDWQDVVDTMRAVPADPEADMEEQKIEKFLSTMKDKIEAAIKSGRTSIIELQRSGAYNTETDEEEMAGNENRPSPSGPSVSGDDAFGDLMGEGGEMEGGEEGNEEPQEDHNKKPEEER